MKTTTLAIVTAMAAGTLAHAQDAVQWRVEDGGNGHWYQLVITGPITWPDARETCDLNGGYLISSRSAAEESLLISIANRADHPAAWVVDFGGNAAGPWLGGFQPIDASPTQPWAWVSGEEWDWVGWAAGEPNGGFGPGLSVTAMLGWAGSNTYRGWADAGLLDYPPYPLPVSYVIEWSADCNADGIVDYGQCRDGSLPDYNGNNIPDCCEQGVPCEVGSYPVQWRVEDGGNGHWYLGVPPVASTTWSAARLMAEQQGGYLATFGSQTELAWAVGGIAANSQLWFLSWGPFLGGTQQDGAKSPTSDWSWIDGSEWTPYWGENDCGADDSCGGQSALSFGQCEISGAISFNDTNIDLPPSGSCTLDARSLLIEFSADCNGDGIVDFGQILLGELADANANGVPDTCECDADINDDDVVNGADISVLLGYWGQSGKNVVGDITGDGVVNGADLAQLLGSWGECP